MQAAAGTLGITTGIAGTAINVTGLSFQPNVVIFFWSGFVTDASVQGASTVALNGGYGFAKSTTERAACVAYSTDASTGSETARRHANDACIIFTDAAGANAGAFDFTSFNADGFSLVTDVAVAATKRFKYLALQVDDSALGSFTEPTSPGNTVVSGLGFQPDAVMLISVSLATAPPAGAVHALLSVGLGCSTEQFVMTGGDEDGVGTQDAITFTSTSEIFAAYNTALTDVTSDAALTSMDSGGFTINHTDTSGTANHIFYLALGGFAAKGGSFTMSGSVGNLPAETGFGFPPTAALFLSSFAAFGTNALSLSMSMGAANSPSSRQTTQLYDDAGGATSDIRQSNHNAAVLTFAAPSATGGLVDLVSFDTDGMTLAMDNVFAVAGTEQAFYLAIGDTPISFDWYLNTNRPPPPARSLATEQQRALAYLVPILELRPNADQTDATWTNELGNNTNLFASIDETYPSDTDYIQSSPGVADLCIIKLATPTVTMLAPLEVRYRYQRKEGTLPIDLRIRLLQGASPIASTTLSNISPAFVTGFFTLSPAEYATISNFADLYLEFRAS